MTSIKHALRLLRSGPRHLLGSSRDLFSGPSDMPQDSGFAGLTRGTQPWNVNVSVNAAFSNLAVDVVSEAFYFEDIRLVNILGN